MQMPTTLATLGALPEVTAAKLVSEPENPGALPILPHESDIDFRIIRDELADELGGSPLGLSRLIAEETAVARWYISRYRQALVVCADRDLESTSPDRGRHGIITLEGVRQALARPRDKEIEPDDLPPLRFPPLSPQRAGEVHEQLDRLIGVEVRRFEEDLALVNQMRQAERQLLAMRQYIHSFDTEPNSPSDGRLNEIRYESFARSRYID